MDKAERFRQLTCTQSLRNELAGRSVRATVATAAAGVADLAIRIGSTAILARLVLPEHFGLVTMVSAVIAIADQLRDLGLSTATVQRAEITHEEITNLFWINTAFGALLALAVCAASPLVAAYYHDPRLITITCVMSTMLLAGGLTVQHQALLTRQLKLGHTALVRLTSSALSTALAIGLAWADFGYWSLLWREVARIALLALGMWICFPWMPGLPSRRTNIRTMLTFGANITGANLVATISAGVDRLLLGRFAGPGAVGIFRQGFQLISAPTDQLSSPIFQVAQPSLSLLQNDPARYRRLFTKMLTLVCLLTMPLSLGVAFYATEITLVLLGPVWIEAAPVICVLSLGTFFKQVIGCTAIIPITRGQGRVYFGLSVLQNVVLIVAMCVGVRWGVLGVAFADVAATYLLIFPRLHYSLAGSPVTARLFFETLARPLTASVAMFAVLLVLPSHLPTLAGVTLAAVTFVMSWLALPGGRAEANELLGDLRSALRRKASRLQPLEPVAATN
jgi:O-antigen/teichoic acid export membrane protein